MLRFFEGKNFKEVGAALGAGEDAAKMRVSRALEKMRGLLAKRGVILSAALIAAAISTRSVEAAPPILAKSVATVAVTKGATAGGLTLALTKGALKVMAWTKAKTAVAATLILIVAAGTATVIINSRTPADRPPPRLRNRSPNAGQPARTPATRAAIATRAAQPAAASTAPPMSMLDQLRQCCGILGRQSSSQFLELLESMGRPATRVGS